MIYSLGITGSSLAFLASAFVLGISFGLQEIFKNLVSGILLIVERPIRVGDFVTVTDQIGIVKRISLRATIVETLDKLTLIIPNSYFITETISNDMINPITRVCVTVEISYNDDPDLAETALKEITREYGKILNDPQPNVVFSNFNASGLEFQLRVFCYVANKVIVASDLRNRIVKKFKEYGIEIPYQKIDLHVKDGEIKPKKLVLKPNKDISITAPS